MPIGRVKWWNDDAGYGFIKSPDGVDVFVHELEIQRDRDGYPKGLTADQEVEYETREGLLGPTAIHVREPGHVEEIETTDRASSRRSGVQRFYAESIRRIEFDINDWAKHDDVTVLSVSVIRISDQGYGALVAYSRTTL